MKETVLKRAVSFVSYHLWVIGEKSRHVSSATGCVTTDTKLGKWAYWDWLKDVAKGTVIPTEPDDDHGGDDRGR